MSTVTRPDGVMESWQDVMPPITSTRTNDIPNTTGSTMLGCAQTPSQHRSTQQPPPSQHNQQQSQQQRLSQLESPSVSRCTQPPSPPVPPSDRGTSATLDGPADEDIDVDKLMDMLLWNDTELPYAATMVVDVMDEDSDYRP